MELKTLEERLMDYGLNDKEAKVYLNLLMAGPAKASEIGHRTKISRMDTYNNLKRLQHVGLVEATMEKPMRFVPLSLDEGLEKLIDAKRGEISRMENNMEFLKEHIKPTISEDVEARFRIHKERKNIHSQLRKMIVEAEESILLMTSKEGLVHIGVTEILDSLIARAKSGIDSRLLTTITKNNEKYANEAADVVKIRHANDIDFNFLIVDRKNIVHSVAVDNARGSSGKEDLAIWMNSQDFINSQTALFDNLWEDALPLANRHEEIETGRVVGPLKVYLGEGSMYEKLKTIIKEGKTTLPPDVATGPFPLYELTRFGIDPGEIFHTLGKRIGSEMAKDIEATEKDAVLKEIKEIWRELGLGKVKIEGEKNLLLTITDTFHCIHTGDKNVGNTLCNLDEGILEGIIDAKLDTCARVKERTCIAMGGKECKFEVLECDEETAES